MADFKMPYGAEFSPDKIKIKEVLKMASAHEGQPTETLVTELAEKYSTRIIRMLDGLITGDSAPLTEEEIPADMVTEDTVSKKKRKCKREKKPSMSFATSFSLAMTKEDEIYDAMAKRILTYLSGLMFIEAIRTITQGGNRPTLENMTETLNLMGCEELSKTNRSVEEYISRIEQVTKEDVLNIAKNVHVNTVYFLKN